mmetsp:Transcript_7025/g.8038  ORF Transcript_7025/g.8038 Transcript_7025/m.8038 type:complete len:412 (+) Transcript_7025:105-1340(+)|eukprot:CAMPEP_0197849036 /NCGR_PEP_ID=MMETSP1438-20131217/10644_1 /TAXON_ID=1461541 /ORGANISM="Pterosperma sp., Strain CCMP1384" /LENGTH=411 /DNA_ID=CAMNT_0043461543 /DNA_START=14 /DNA_END=1249 /DNA_ORIENTATION=-
MARRSERPPEADLIESVDSPGKQPSMRFQATTFMKTLRLALVGLFLVVVLSLTVGGRSGNDQSMQNTHVDQSADVNTALDDIIRKAEALVADQSDLVQDPIVADLPVQTPSSTTTSQPKKIQPVKSSVAVPSPSPKKKLVYPNANALPLPKDAPPFAREFIKLTAAGIQKATRNGDEGVVLQIGAHTLFEKTDETSPMLEVVLDACSTGGVPWKWILVEPVPSNFEVLHTQLPDSTKLDMDNFVFENLAIGKTDQPGTIPFYTISKDIDAITGMDSRTGIRLPTWATQIGSFSKDHLLKHEKGWKKKGLEVRDYIEALPVTVMSIGGILKKNGIRADQLGALLIDTEGFDCVIIQALDIASYQPALLYFEYKWCNLQDKDKALKKLKAYYNCKVVSKENIMCSLNPARKGF